MLTDFRFQIKQLLFSLCVWILIVLSAVVLAQAHIAHKAGLPSAARPGALLLMLCLLTPLGVITILPIFAISRRLPRWAAPLAGFVVGALLSIGAGYVVGVYVVGGFEGTAGFMGMGLVCALPSGVASAIAGYVLARPKPLVR